MELKNLDITTAKINQFKTKGINTVEELVNFFPRKYLDFRNPANVSQVRDKEICSIIITIYDIIEYPGRISIKGRDINGDTLFISYFGNAYIANVLNIGDTVIFCGQVNVGFNRFVSMTNPISFSKDIETLQKIMPIYSKINGMSSDYFNKTINTALNIINKNDYLEMDIIKQFNLMSISEALRAIHNPKDMDEITRAQSRFLFDDLFYFNYELQKNAMIMSKKSDFKFVKHDICSKYINNLPFKLTEGQLEAVKTALSKTINGERLNLLVQGDVGCGKTEVAKITLLAAVNNGYQGILLAPTNVLATQHFNDLTKSFEGLNVNVAFLTGDTKKKERAEILEKIKSGEINILVGTHAVLNDEIIYKNLALVIVDEEHKFGVEQKEKLRQKGSKGVHSISLSATPIPRTLAMNIYGGSVDIVTITSSPQGKLPIKTMATNKLRLNENTDQTMAAAYYCIEQVVQNGNQAYIVCPVIEENDKIESVEDSYKDAREYFEPLGITVGMINGKMKQEEIANIVNRFANHEFDVLVSTTIIEVGVNVPNATFMLIKSAERFGLSQLHQLRGRVGRGKEQGYCLLYTNIDLNDDNNINARKKLEIMSNTADGFVISEEDLKLRGAGDLLGTTQTGDDKYLLLALQNQELDAKIKKLVTEILQDEHKKAHYDKHFIKDYID